MQPAAHSQALMQGRLDAERAHDMSTGVGERDPADMMESIPSSKDRERGGANAASSAPPGARCIGRDSGTPPR